MEKRALVSASMTNLAVVPDRITTKLRYVDVVALSTSVVTYASNFFRLNSIYDPDQSGTGHQPTGHDEWAAFYGYYRVLRTHVRVRFSSAANYHVTVILPTRSTSSPIYPYSSSEDARAQWSTQIPNGHACELNATYDIRALFGVSKDLYGQAAYAATFGANPANEFYLEVSAFAIQSVGGTCYATVELTYEVEMYERVELGPSLVQAVKSLSETSHPMGCQCVSCKGTRKQLK